MKYPPSRTNTLLWVGEWLVQVFAFLLVVLLGAMSAALILSFAWSLLT